MGIKVSQVIRLDCSQLGAPSREWVGNGESLTVLEQGSDWLAGECHEAYSGTDCAVYQCLGEDLGSSGDVSCPRKGPC